MRSRALIALGAIGVLAGCADLLGFKTLQAPPPDDAGPDVFVCQHVLWPDPPTTPGSGTPTSYDLAVHHVHLTQTEDGGAANFGFDLDHTCTMDTSSASCQPGAKGTLITDGVGGVDNESIALVNLLKGQETQLQNVLSDDAFNAEIDAGTFTVLIRILGLLDDKNQASNQSLTVALQTAPAIITAPPIWDGTDRWQPATSDTVGPGSNYPKASLIMDAYVTNGTLVATSDGPITLNMVLPQNATLTGVLPLTLRKIVFTGKLVKRPDGNYDMTNGLLGGRWSAEDLLTSVASLSYLGQALCEYNQSIGYQILVAEVCPKQDITSTGVDVGSQKCDAFSTAMAFDAVAVTVSNNPVPAPTSTTPCPDAGTCPN